MCVCVCVCVSVCGRYHFVGNVLVVVAVPLLYHIN